MTTYTQTRIVFAPTSAGVISPAFFLRPSGDVLYYLPGTANPIALAPNMYARTTVGAVTQSIPNIGNQHSIPFRRVFGVNHTTQPPGYWVGGARSEVLTVNIAQGNLPPGQLGIFSNKHSVRFDVDTFDHPNAPIKARYGFRFSGLPTSLTTNFAPLTVQPHITLNLNVWVYRVPFEQSYHQVNGIWRFK
jgi:hypothetical protein